MNAILVESKNKKNDIVNKTVIYSYYDEIFTLIMMKFSHQVIVDLLSSFITLQTF